jgi:GPH family glycoside/pentoside/hexuronide:cation symporter
MKKISYLRYALGILGLSLVSQLFHSYNYSYYVDELGMAITLATLSKIVFIGFDAINDIIIGRLSDRTNAKRGKRMPWLLYCAPYFGIALILAYLPNKNFDKSLIFGYYLAITLGFELFATIMYVNYGALFPIIYRSETERANASVAKQSFSILGMGIGAALPPFLFNLIGYLNTAVVFAIIYLIIVYISLSGIKETTFDYKTTIENSVSLKSAFLDTYNNKRFIYYNLAQAFMLSVNAIILTVFPFYAQYSLKIQQSQQSIMLLILFTSALLSLTLWKKLIIKIGINNTWILAFAIYALTIITLLFAYDLLTGCLAAGLVGIGLAGVYVTPDLIISYIIDIDFKKHKIHREASFMAMGNFVQKISLAISALVVMLITSLFGFVSGDQPGDYPGLTFSVLMGLIPVLLLAISYFLAKKYIQYDNTHAD